MNGVCGGLITWDNNRGMGFVNMYSLALMRNLRSIFLNAKEMVSYSIHLLNLSTLDLMFCTSVFFFLSYLKWKKIPSCWCKSKDWKTGVLVKNHKASFLVEI